MKGWEGKWYIKPQCSSVDQRLINSGRLKINRREIQQPSESNEVGNWSHHKHWLWSSLYILFLPWEQSVVSVISERSETSRSHPPLCGRYRLFPIGSSAVSPPQRVVPPRITSWGRGNAGQPRALFAVYLEIQFTDGIQQHSQRRIDSKPPDTYFNRRGEFS